MPTVPKVQRSSEPIANLPQIQTPRADPDAFGAGLGRALGSTVSAALNGASAIIATRNRIRERQAAEAADAALVEYNSWASGAWHGTPDPVTGQLTPGLAARQSARQGHQGVPGPRQEDRLDQAAAHDQVPDDQQRHRSDRGQQAFLPGLACPHISGGRRRPGAAGG